MVQSDNNKNTGAQPVKTEVSGDSFFRMMADFAYDWIYWQNSTGDIEYSSDSCERITGYKPDDFINQKSLLEDIVYPADRKIWHKHKSEVLLNPEYHEIQFRIIHKNGTIRWIEHVCQSVRDSQGSIEGLCVSNRDISVRQKTQESLRQSEMYFRSLFDQAAETIVVYDLHGNFLMANQQALMNLGYSQQELIRMNICDIDIHVRVGKSTDEIRKKITDGVPGIFETLYRRKDGHIFPVEVRFSVVDFEDQKVLFSLSRDISGKRLTEIHEKRHLAELSHASRLSIIGEMAAAMAHELSQPLTSITITCSAIARLLKKQNQDLFPEINEAFKQISIQAKHAEIIFSQMKNFTRLNTNPDCQASFEEALQVIKNLLYYKFQEKNITFLHQIDKDCPKVFMDQVQLDQVLLNLIQNSIESLEEAQGTLRLIQLRVIHKSDQEVEVLIADCGKGFNIDFQEKIFKSFFTTKKQGLGIGLSLSRKIVEAYGGRIWAENRVARGAVFHFTVPLKGL